MAMARKRGLKRAEGGGVRNLGLIVDPRLGDIEDDASSTKRRSMLSLAGSLLAEISLPKLLVAWSLLLVVPGFLLGLAPIIFVAGSHGGTQRLRVPCPVRVQQILKSSFSGHTPNLA